jgi:site-specific DNA-methyltransferase (adenine-specific)
VTEPYWSDGDVTLYLGDCLEVLAAMEDGSVDAVITDPPYGLEFMGREWDRFSGDVADRDFKGFVLSQQRTRNVKCPDCGKWAYDHPGRLCECGGIRRAQVNVFQSWCEAWAAECLRVLKPGGWMLAFGGTRTWHRLTCAIEDAGFEIRDGIPDLTGYDAPGLIWVHGQGFPKSLDVSKAIDKAAGAEREVVGTRPQFPDGTRGARARPNACPEVFGDRLGLPGEIPVTAPATEAATRWEGWGTALKPAWEPIVVARKPLAGTVAQNVLTHGTGALNVDGCRIHTPGSEGKPYTVKRLKPGATLEKTGGNWRPDSDEELPWEAGREYQGETKDGRWPPNVVLGPTAAAELDRQSGTRPSGGDISGREPSGKTKDAFGEFSERAPYVKHRDEGGASRFFPVFRYEAKAATSERPRLEDGTAHPTVKPVDLMAWLVRLVTPPGGLVLDPFAGSGTTAEACIVEGFRCILIEQDPKSAELIKTRLSKPIQPVLFGDLESA